MIFFLIINLLASLQHLPVVRIDLHIALIDYVEMVVPFSNNWGGDEP